MISPCQFLPGKAGNFRDSSYQSILNNALDAFARFDTEAALRTFSQDQQIDLDYQTALRESVTYMMEDPMSISRVINILWVIRSLERVGDHAKNLCEQIVFVVRGTDIRHQAVFDDTH